MRDDLSKCGRHHKQCQKYLWEIKIAIRTKTEWRRSRTNQRGERIRSPAAGTNAMTSTLVFFPPSPWFRKLFRAVCHSKVRRRSRFGSPLVALGVVAVRSELQKNTTGTLAINGVCRRLNKHLLSHLEKETRVSVGQRVIMPNTFAPIDNKPQLCGAQILGRKYPYFHVTIK